MAEVQNTPLKQRLLEFIEYKHLTAGRFERICGLGNAMVQNTNATMSIKTIERISNAFPELNLEWLRTGEGEMLLPTSEHDTIERLVDALNKANEVIVMQQKTIQELVSKL